MATISGIVTADTRFSILEAVINYVDGAIPTDTIGTTLAGAAELTVFAPTDVAFTQLAKDLGFAGPFTDTTVITFLTTPTPNLTAQALKNILFYHVSSGEKTLSQIDALTTVATSLNDSTITPDGRTLIDNDLNLINAVVIKANLRADNGIIQVIDRVMLPVDLPSTAPTIAATLAASGGAGTYDTTHTDFDILRDAVGIAGLGAELEKAGADLTVFAPNDAAFMQLAAKLGFEGADEGSALAYLGDALTLLSDGNSPAPLLAKILNYHFVKGSVQESQINKGDRFETVNGESFSFNGTKLVDNLPGFGNAKLIDTDLQTANGVIHVINRVLLPEDFLNQTKARDVDFIIGKDTAETISTGRGNDWVDANDGGDYVSMGHGRDVALGGTGDDVIFGGADRDRLMGETGDDFIDGGAGRDRIIGGAGDDLLRGGQGADVFVFATDAKNTSTGDDLIIDFRDGTDRIRINLDGLDAFDDLVVTNVDGVASIDLGGGNSISLTGMTAANLTATDFIFS